MGSFFARRPQLYSAQTQTRTLSDCEPALISRRLRAVDELFEEASPVHGYCTGASIYIVGPCVQTASPGSLLMILHPLPPPV